MTCCLAACLPHVSVAAADTRILIHHDGQVTPHDGPHPITLHVASLGKTLVCPYHYRKIRKVGEGWVVITGEYESGSRVLDLLKGRSAILFTEARGALARDRGLLQRITKETGILDEKLRETLLIGSPFATTARVWTLGLGQQDPRSGRSKGSSVVSWPAAVPAHVKRDEDALLYDFLRSVTRTTKPIDYAKALARVILAAAAHASDSSSLVQFGGTFMGPDGAPQSVYFDGSCAELLGMNDEEFGHRLEIAQ